MKESRLSKLEQIKALREGRFDKAAVTATVENTPFFGALKAGHIKTKPSRNPPGAVTWLAPEGECASCDKRRAALQATMRKRRAKPS